MEKQEISTPNTIVDRRILITCFSITDHIFSDHTYSHFGYYDNV